MTVKLPKKLTGFLFLYIKMTVHITQLTGKMHVRGWTSGRVQKFIVFALKANTSKPHAKVFFWYPGKIRANTTAN